MLQEITARQITWDTFGAGRRRLQDLVAAALQRVEEDPRFSELDPGMLESLGNPPPLPQEEDDPAGAGTGLDPRRDPADSPTLLGTPHHAEAIARLLRSAQGEMAMAVFGDWGTGKTTLAREVERRLADPARQTGEPRLTYRTVHFSAWQYRKPPETWAYLYETCAKAFLPRSLPPHARLARILRVATARNGLQNLVMGLMAIWAALGLGLLALWWSGQVKLAAVPALAFLPAAIAALPKLWKSAREPAERFARRFGTLAGHSQALGLQAAIGTDLRALLRAWRPSFAGGGPRTPGQVLRHVLSPQPRGDTLEETFPRPWLLALLVMGLAPCAVAALLLAEAALIPAGGLLHRAAVALMPDGAAEPKAGDLVAIALVFLALGLVTLGVLFGLFLPRTGTDRILLVVDDLDRCVPDEAMVIVEAVKLLLDDRDVSDRMQVLMLIDDRVFDLAAARKFKDLIDERLSLRPGAASADAATQRAVRAEIVREHRDKLFLAHLRLQPVPVQELEALMGSYCAALAEVPPAKRLSGSLAVDGPGEDAPGSPGGPGGDGPAAGGGHGPAGPLGPRDPEARPELSAVITPEERVALQQLVRTQADVATPRNVRSFLLRYQFGRLLRQLARPGGAPMSQAECLDLMRALHGAMFAGAIPPDTPPDIAAIVRRIA